MRGKLEAAKISLRKESLCCRPSRSWLLSSSSIANTGHKSVERHKIKSTCLLLILLKADCQAERSTVLSTLKRSARRTLANTRMSGDRTESRQPRKDLSAGVNRLFLRTYDCALFPGLAKRRKKRNSPMMHKAATNKNRMIVGVKRKLKLDFMEFVLPARWSRNLPGTSDCFQTRPGIGRAWPG